MKERERGFPGENKEEADQGGGYLSGAFPSPEAEVPWAMKPQNVLSS